MNSSGGLTNGAGLSSVSPAFNPIPTPDNSNSNTGSSPSTTLSGSTSLSNTTNSGPTLAPITPKICQIDDPLVYTPAEQAQLDILLKQYYLISPSLKTSDDLALELNDMNQNQSLINQSNTLTNQCMQQKSAPSYTGPQSIKDNPYYQDPSGTNSNTPYLPAYTQFEQILNIW